MYDREGNMFIFLTKQLYVEICKKYTRPAQKHRKKVRTAVVVVVA